MNPILGAGIALSVVGVAAYVAGIWIPFEGRAFSVTALMVGVTMIAIGRSHGAGPEGGSA